MDESKGPKHDEVSERWKVSLVIPVRNEVASLPALIHSIREQTFPPDEVILVDGGSADATVALAHQLTRESQGFRVVKAVDATPGRGRNIGIAAAGNEWIALTDGGVFLEPRWLEELVKAAAANPTAGIVYGNFEALAQSFWQHCGTLIFVHPQHERPEGRMRGPSIASCLLRRNTWTAVGGFPDFRAAEDLMFMERVHEMGLVEAWAPKATIWWQPPPTLAAVFRRFVLFSKNNVWAGRQSTWQYGLARSYLLALPFIVLSALVSYWWLLVPLFILAARVAKHIVERREQRSIFWLLNPVRFLGVSLVLLIIDFASFCGWAQAALLQRPPTRQMRPNDLQLTREGDKP